MQEQQLLQPERIPECDLIILLRDYISAKHLSVTCLQSLILRLSSTVYPSGMVRFMVRDT